MACIYWPGLLKFRSSWTAFKNSNVCSHHKSSFLSRQHHGLFFIVLCEDWSDCCFVSELRLRSKILGKSWEFPMSCLLLTGSSCVFWWSLIGLKSSRSIVTTDLYTQWLWPSSATKWGSLRGSKLRKVLHCNFLHILQKLLLYYFHRVLVFGHVPPPTYRIHTH